MASSKRSADSPNATRQMLDELDALMERMLSLPANDGNDPPTSTLAATMTVVPAEPEVVQPPSLHKIRNHKSLPKEPPSYRTEPDERPEPAKPAWDRTEPMPLDEDILPPLSEQTNPPARQYSGQRPSWSHWIFRPLLWINQIYDQSTKVLGPFGRWLRDSRGRTLLGYIGLILLCLAIAWGLRDWFSMMW